MDKLYASEYNWPYDQDFFIILNMAIGPKWGDSYLPDSSSSIEGQQMLIDWVRVLTPKEEEAQA